jgi:E1A-binding protein p400
MWNEKRLPRVLEPVRPKTHWDYLLEEMAWLAQDFAAERKWKKTAAKKHAKLVQKQAQDAEQLAEKRKKEEEQKLKKIAAFCAREVRNFWGKVEKVRLSFEISRFKT